MPSPEGARSRRAAEPRPPRPSEARARATFEPGISLEIARARTEPTVGPYRLLETLGKGAMGVVHVGLHQATGQRVAVKTVSAPRAVPLASLRREILALAKLSHPGVVRIVDEGIADGVPWYAMELHEGRTLRALMQGDPNDSPSGAARTTTPLASRPARRDPRGARERVPANLPELLATVRDLCPALSYVHGEGIVHRDLKPDNVLLAGDRPVILDFGLSCRFAALQGRETLEVYGDLAGTAWYMAPEQVRGEAVDARADLYALGCILYEIVTGQPPFLGDRDVLVLMKHLHEEPEPPSAHVAGVAPALEALILRLLAKDAHRRVGHATDVAAGLASFAADGGPRETPPARSYLYRPRLIGRQPVLDRLAARLLSVDGAGAIAALEGESGSGKTRIGMELAARGMMQGFRVLTGNCQPPSEAGGMARPPLHPLRDALADVADHCREGGAEAARRVLGGTRGRVLAPYDPAIAALTAGDPEPPALPPAEEVLRVHRSLAETFAALAESSPLLMILDDVHGADDLTIGFLQYLTRSETLRNARVRLLLLARPEEATAAVLDLLSRFHPERADPLDLFAVAALAAEMLGLDDAPEALARFLGRQSEGNPFFAVQYLSHLVAGGQLDRGGSGRWRLLGADVISAREEDFPIPTSLRDLIERRLAGLSCAASEVVRAAAVLGRDSPESLVGRVSDLPERSFLEGLGELIARHVVDEPAAGRVRFTHDQIRDIVYAGIGGQQRRASHRKAAGAIAALPVAPERQGELGHHWERAEEADRARECYLAAARLATRRYAHDDADTFYRAYLRLVPGPTTESVRARNELGRSVLRLKGPLERALEEQRIALEEARTIGDPGTELEVSRNIAQTLRMMGRVDDARKAFARTLDLARAQGDATIEALAKTDFAIVLQNQGRLDEAEQMCRDAIAIHQRSGERRHEASALDNLAGVHHERGKLVEARAMYEEALARHREFGDRHREAATMGDLGHVLRDMGRADEARHCYFTAAAINEEVGDRRHHGVALAAAASVLFDVEDDAGKALPLFEQALAIFREVGELRAEGVTLGNIGVCLDTVGRIEEGRQRIAQALAIHRRIGNRRSEAVALGHLADFAASDGDLASAREMLSEALALARGIGHLKVTIEILDRWVKLFHDRLGDPGGAAPYERELEELRRQLGGERG
ncbi:MAG: tetratricopeptide repeat protein [Acidobacteriota bacterium]